MAEPWLLRRATPADLDAIMAIETVTFVDDAWSREQLRAELEAPHRHYLVAERGSAASAAGATDAAVAAGAADQSDAAGATGERSPAIDGYAGLFAPPRSGQGDIQTIAVAEPSRRAGLGRTLMLALIAEARRRDVVELFLEVRADNPGAQQLYEQLGFEAIAVRPHYYQPADVDAIVMRLLMPEPHTEFASGDVAAAASHPHDPLGPLDPAVAEPGTTPEGAPQ